VAQKEGQPIDEPVEVDPSNAAPAGTVGKGNYSVPIEELTKLGFEERNDGLDLDVILGDGNDGESETDSQPEGTEGDEDIDEVAQLKKELSPESEKTDEKEKSSDEKAETVYEIGDEKITMKEFKELKDSGLRDKDYRQKTMALADERKEVDALRAKTEEFQQEIESKYETELTQKEHFDQLVDWIKETDHEFFDQFQEKNAEWQKHSYNPQYEAKLKAQARSQKEIEQKLADNDEDRMREVYLGQEKRLDILANKYKHLELKWDKEKVVDRWVEEGGTLVDNFKILYGDNLLDLAVQKQKTAKPKVRRIGVKTAGTIKNKGAVVVETVDPTKDWNYSQIANAIIEGKIA